MKCIIWIIITFSPLLSFGALAIDAEHLMKRANRYFSPLPDTMPGSEKDTPQLIALGKKLFFEKRLSINNTQSCASCHRLDKGFAGTDNKPTSAGALGQPGSRNSPSVLNAGWQDSQFWDGRAMDLVEQAKGPILNPAEMGMPDEKTVEDKIRSIVEYREAFTKAFPTSVPAITYQNIAIAIAAFERTLSTPSRFDDFMLGNPDALNDSELRGLKIFLKIDCKSCHDGKLLGGELYEKLGKEHPYENQSDQGIYALTKDPEDRMVFKVAQLRNIALTAPYFHDGKVKTLEEAVEKMAMLQLNEELDNQQIKDITNFLRSLTDKNRQQYLSQ